MTIKDLDSKLTESLESYKQEIKAVIDDEYSKEVLTKGEAMELSKAVFYTLSEFSEAIVEYLETNKK